MEHSWTVETPSRLIPFLREQLPEWKRTTLEQRVAGGYVLLNGTVCPKNAPLSSGDTVQLKERPSALPSAGPGGGLRILHADELLVAVDKPAGLLSVAASGERERTALALLRTHLAQSDPEARLWPVHRLDRETSGVLLFARFEDVCSAVQADWENTEKRYLAWVTGYPEPAEGLIDAPLWEDQHLFVHVGRGRGSKPARTRYRTLETKGQATLLEVALETGRRHQIRAHMASIGHPVVGDSRYGTKGGPMLLHAWRLTLNHPSGGRLRLEAPVARRFKP